MKSKINNKVRVLTFLPFYLFTFLLFTGCSDFLDKPTEDSYNTDNYYDSDAACIAGVNYLYNSPWYDFQRGFIKVGEVMSGNMYWGSSPYLNFSVNGTDEDLKNMSYSLWAEIAHCSTVYNSLKGATNTSEATKNQCMGECLAWKAMAYFYLVRSFGDVPIIHDNSETLARGDYNTLHKVCKYDVYDYIIMTLEKAMELLPRQKNTNGHIDYYCAEGLLAKVYLTRAGCPTADEELSGKTTGTLKQDDLTKAAQYAKDVIQNSGRELMSNYEDIFRGSNNISDESLFAWHWTVGAHWTCQNTLQSDLAPQGFDENGDCWGGWGGPSYDLMLAFGVDPKDDPSKRIDTDVRRKATIMMAGDYYSYFWRDKTIPTNSRTNPGKKGFDVLAFYYNTDYNSAAPGQFQGPCGGQNVKNLYGDQADHQAEMGIASGRMANALATHILRLSDVYLVYAEAEVLLGNTTDPLALECYNHVHGRGTNWTAETKTSLTFDDIWKERRLEFAGEGDRWYDFVRRAYYAPEACVNEIKSQKRNAVWNCDEAYKNYYNSGTWDASGIQYDDQTAAPNVTVNSFSLPFPTEDVTLNPNLATGAAPEHVDVRATYSY